MSNTSLLSAFQKSVHPLSPASVKNVYGMVEDNGSVDTYSETETGRDEVILASFIIAQCGKKVEIVVPKSEMSYMMGRSFEVMSLLSLSIFEIGDKIRITEYDDTDEFEIDSDVTIFHNCLDEDSLNKFKEFSEDHRLHNIHRIVDPK